MMKKIHVRCVAILSKLWRSEKLTRYNKIYLNSVNYFSDFCESDGGDVASGQNIPRAKMLLFKGHDTFCQKMQEKPRSQR